MSTAIRERKSHKATKEVQPLYRITFKDPARAGIVVYVVLSSDGETTYTTTLVDGRATGCSCPAMKPCYHMSQLEQREQECAQKQAEMHEAAQVAPTILGEQFSQDLQAHVEDDLRSEPWAILSKEQKREMYRNMYPDDYGYYGDVA